MNSLISKNQKNNNDNNQIEYIDNKIGLIVKNSPDSNSLKSQNSLPALEAQHDHHDFGPQWDLFHFEESSPGMVFWHPNGQAMMRVLENSSRSLYEEHNYQEVRSPQLLDQSLWVKSGHWDKYRENMFVVKSEGEGSSAHKLQALKPMSCPGHISIFQNSRKSYRQLPFRLFEFGVVHRNEPSGSLNGLLRLRSFVQDDAHIFVDVQQIEGEVKNFIDMVQKAYSWFGFEVHQYKISLRPDMRAGSDENWDKAEDALRWACQKMELEYVEAPGEGAFYGPKLEVSLMDRLGREWQCGVMQVDFVLPERFELEYMGANGQFQQPALLHQAVFGSLERWLAIVLEHFGSQVPLWLAPQQFAILPISKNEDSLAFCQNLKKLMKKRGARVIVKSEEQPLKQNMKSAFDSFIPWVVVIGQKEIDENRVSLRHRNGDQIQLNQEDFLDKLSDMIQNPGV